MAEKKTNLQDFGLTKVEKGNEGLYPIECEDSAISELVNTAERVLTKINGYDEFPIDMRFRNIRVYGTKENPLFLLNCINNYIYPGRGDSSGLIKRFKNKKVIPEHFRSDFYIILPAFIQRKTKGSEKIHMQFQDKNGFITEQGLMFAFSIVVTPLTNAFQKLLLKLINNIRDNDATVWKRNLEKTTAELTEKLIDLKKKNKYLEQGERGRITCAEYMTRVDFGDASDKKELLIRRGMAAASKGSKALAVFVVDKNFLNKTQNAKKSKKKAAKSAGLRAEGLSDTDTEDDEAKQEFHMSRVQRAVFDMSDLSDDDDDDVDYDHLHYSSIEYQMLTEGSVVNNILYFHVQSWVSKSKKNHMKTVAQLVFENRVQYDATLRALASRQLEQSDAITARKKKEKIFAVSYAELLEIHQEVFIEMFQKFAIPEELNDRPDVVMCRKRMEDQRNEVQRLTRYNDEREMIRNKKPQECDYPNKDAYKAAYDKWHTFAKEWKSYQKPPESGAAREKLSDEVYANLCERWVLCNDPTSKEYAAKQKMTEQIGRGLKL